MNVRDRPLSYTVRVRFDRSLDLDLLLWTRDANLGDARYRIELPQRLASLFRARSREPELCRRLFHDDVAGALERLAQCSSHILVDDNGIRVNSVDAAFKRVKRRTTAAAKLIETRRRILPRSDHAAALRASWSELAARHDGRFDEMDERLDFETELGRMELSIHVVDRRTWTVFALQFGRKLPIDFELCEHSDLDWLGRFFPPFAVDAKTAVRLYVKGSRQAARRELDAATVQGFLRLRSACDAVCLSAGELYCRLPGALVDHAEIERIVDLVLEAVAPLEPRHVVAHGPYR